MLASDRGTLARGGSEEKAWSHRHASLNIVERSDLTEATTSITLLSNERLDPKPKILRRIPSPNTTVASSSAVS